MSIHSSLKIVRRLVPVFAVYLAVLLAGCSSSAVRDDRTSRDLYEEGLLNMEKKRYGAATEAFREAANLYRDAALDADIQMGLAEAYFRDVNYEAAIEAYGEFLRLHPRNSRSAEAQYQIGMSYFEQIRGPDRSQEFTEEALESFEKVIRSYPRSEFVGKAREKTVLCRRRLAEHELYVGKYYMRQREYSAALPRFDRLFHDFNDLGYGDEALYHMGLCYRKMDKDGEADRVWDVLKRDYPHSRFLEKL